jgi:2,3-bisphosphoglycerate-dependent phosphoglycerate mutase
MKTRQILFWAFMCVCWGSILSPVLGTEGQDPSAVTTIFLVRHAEKIILASPDPPLTAEGTARAQELAYLLEHVHLDAVYATPYLRTRYTGLPTAKAKGLEIQEYKPGDKGFMERLLKEHTGEAILIIGHSNTIPSLANQLLRREEFSDLDDATYDNLFIASVPARGQPQVLRIRFGIHTPEVKHTP